MFPFFPAKLAFSIFCFPFFSARICSIVLNLMYCGTNRRIQCLWFQNTAVVVGQTRVTLSLVGHAHFSPRTKNTEEKKVGMVKIARFS